MVSYHSQLLFTRGMSLFVLSLCLSFIAVGQKLSISETISIAKENNAGLEAYENRVQKSNDLISCSIDIDKTEVFYNYDENNLAPNNIPLKVWGVSQSFKFPTLYGAQKKVSEGEAALVQDDYLINQLLLSKKVSKAYYEVVNRETIQHHYHFLDSLYNEFAIAVRNKFEQGETNYLEKLTAKSKRKEIALALEKSTEAVNKSYIILNQWLQTDSIVSVVDTGLFKLPLKIPNVNNHPCVNYYADAVDLSQRSVSLEKQNLLPDLRVSVFQGYNNGPNTRSFTGFEAGIALPIWFSANKAKINASQSEALILAAESENYKIMLASKLKVLLSDLKQYEEELSYYNETGKALSQELISHATKAYRNEKITFLRFVDLLEDSKNIDINYLKTLFNNNNTVLEINYLSY